MAGGGGGCVMNWEIGIDMYTLICIKWITNKNLLYTKINKIKFKKNCMSFVLDIKLGSRFKTFKISVEIK